MQNFQVLLLAGLLAVSVARAETPPLPSTVHVSFNQHQPQPYTGKILREDWVGTVWDGTRGRAQILADADKPNDRFMRVKYPAGGFGPTKSGGQVLVHIPPAEEYYLSYKIRFQQGFDFRRGGKLPGLASGDGKYSNGLHPVDGDGWTARLMPKESHWGDSWRINASIKPNTWQTITQHIRLNSPGKSNGLYAIWVNGEKVTERNDMLWRYANKGLIDSFIFSTFHGGNTQDWAPRWDSHADFDDFEITRQAPARLRSQFAQR
jgi:hypothetical protein